MNNSTAQLYATAAVLSISNLLYTSIAILPTNNALKAIAQSSTSEGLEKTVELVKKWDGLNMKRGYLVLASAVLGTWLTASREV